MKNHVKFFAMVLLMATTIAVKAQSTDEIIAKHQAAMGSPEKWAAVTASQVIDIAASASGALLAEARAFEAKVEVETDDGDGHSMIVDLYDAKAA